MTPADFVGTWLLENAVPMGPGVMRIKSAWKFAADGGATLSTKSELDHQGTIVTSSSTKHEGRWTIDGDRLVIDLPDHEDSPFKLSLTESGELRSRTRGTWKRVVEG
jgi:hypothetical protein